MLLGQLSSLPPAGQQPCGGHRVIELSKEAFERVGDILHEVLPWSELHGPGIPPELSQEPQAAGAGTPFPVYALQPEPVLSDKADAGVHDDGDVAPAHLLLLQPRASATGCPANGCAPCGEV